jgi:hypothetical protein
MIIRTADKILMLTVRQRRYHIRSVPDFDPRVCTALARSWRSISAYPRSMMTAAMQLLPIQRFSNSEYTTPPAWPQRSFHTRPAGASYVRIERLPFVSAAAPPA